MNYFLNEQLGLFLIYIGGGILISLLFDVFRASRKSIKTADLVTYIEDIIFLIIVASFLIYLIFILSTGEIRAFIFIGLLFGSLLYYFTLSKFFMKICVCIFTFLKKILLIPFNIALKFNKNLICLVCINIQNMTKVLKKIPKATKNSKTITNKEGF